MSNGSRCWITLALGLSCLAGLAAPAPPPLETCGDVETCRAAALEAFAERGYLGMGFHHVARGGPANLVVHVVMGGAPADRAGLREGDHILRVDGEPVAEDEAAVIEKFSSVAIGQGVALEIEREGKVKTVLLEALPPPEGYVERWADAFVHRRSSPAVQQADGSWVRLPPGHGRRAP